MLEGLRGLLSTVKSLGKFVPNFFLFRQHRQGVKQGGVLSPFLFAVYVDDLIGKLRQSGCGLYIGSMFTGALL